MKTTFDRPWGDYATFRASIEGELAKRSPSRFDTAYELCRPLAHRERKAPPAALTKRLPSDRARV